MKNRKIGAFVSLVLMLLGIAGSSRAQSCLYIGEYPADELVPTWLGWYQSGDMCADSPYGNGDGQLTAPDYTAFLGWIAENWDGPGGPDRPAWWPISGESVDTGELGLEAALEAVNGRGGVLELSSQADADGFVDELRSSSLTGGGESRRLVVTAGEGVRIREPIAMRNGRNLLRHVVFYGVDFVPDSHTNTDAVHLRGSHYDLGFVSCRFEGWSGGVIGGSGGDPDDRFDERPSSIWLETCEFTRIFNSNAPKQTADNWRKKTYRSQVVYFGSVEDLTISYCTFADNGYDVEADPLRLTPSMYSQNIYLGQAAEGVLIVGNVIDNAANNAIVAKGRDVTVRDNSATRVVNFIALGTNESPEFPFSGVIEGNVASDFVPVNHLDDATLAGGRAADYNSGVAVSIVNCDGVIIRGNIWGGLASVGTATPRRSAAYMVGNGKASSCVLSGVVVSGDELIGFDRLVEMRDHRRPPGQSLRFYGVTGASSVGVFVRNTEPGDRRSAAAGIEIDGVPADLL